ncbi:hypothetical protein Tco_0727255, partial [Tanacetum coccineum]
SPQPFISPSVTQHSQADFPQLDSGLAVPTFHQGEDPIECINKAMASYLLWHQGFHLQTINSEHLPIPRIRQPFKMVESQFNKLKEDNESQDEVIQDTNSSEPNDLLVLSLVVQMTDHVAHLDKENQTNKMVNESLTTELERYKERNRNAKLVAFQQEINTLKETLSNNVKEKEVEAPSELTKVSLVNESLKKLKYQLANFDNVVKKRTTSDAITADEIAKVQTVFNQMEAAVDQCSVDKNTFEIQIKQLSIDNDQLLKQIMSQEILHIAVNSMDIFDVKNSVTKKDTVIRKLKDRIKSLSVKDSVENVKKDIDEIETINIELEHKQFDSIRKTRVQSKEHCNSLIAQINANSVENLDLNAQLQEKVFAIATLKNKLRKLKGKNIVDTAVSKPSATIAPGMFKLDIEPISHRLKNNRDAHEVNEARDPVMSSSSTVTYTSVYTDSEPGRVFWGADEELSDGGSPRVIVYRYDGLPMQPVAPPSLNYVPGPEHSPFPDYVPGPKHLPVEPLPIDASLTALSPGYVADSGPYEDSEEDPEEDHADYPTDGGDDVDEPSNDDDDDTDDEDEEPFKDEDDDEEEEHLAPTNSFAKPIVDPVPSAGDIEAFETDESAPTPRSP